MSVRGELAKSTSYVSPACRSCLGKYVQLSSMKQGEEVPKDHKDGVEKCRNSEQPSARPPSSSERLHQFQGASGRSPTSWQARPGYSPTFLHKATEPGNEILLCRFLE